MSRLVPCLVLLFALFSLSLASCSVDIGGSGSSSDASLDGCVPGAFPGVAQGIIWLDEDVDPEDPIWIASQMDASPFIDWHRFVDQDDIGDDLEVADFFARHETATLPVDGGRQLFLVTMESVSAQETVDAIFDEFSIFKGVSEVVVGQPTC